MSVSITYRRHPISCNDIIINNIVANYYGGINKTKLIFIFIVGHLGFILNNKVYFRQDVHICIHKIQLKKKKSTIHIIQSKQ